MSKKILFSVLGLALVTLAAVNAPIVSAQDTSAFSSLVTKIAGRFNLKESDVKVVFDEARQEHHAQMQVRYVEWLTQAVRDGKITEAQKQLLVAKHKEVGVKRVADMEDFKNLTLEEQRAAKEKVRTELETWAKQNGIDLSYLFGGFGHHKRMRMGFWK